MRILVTGAGGLVGRKLVEALAAQKTVSIGGDSPKPITEIVAHDLRAPSFAGGGVRITPMAGDLTKPGDVDAAIGDGVDVVVHLAAIVSGQAESDFDLGYRVNLDGTRALLEACRHKGKTGQAAGAGTRPMFVFASTTATYGGDLPPVVPDNLRLTPTSSYGTQKVIGELLVSDYTRKGFVDGRAFRFPTIVVRPGAPNAALSSFVSSIVREPLSGKEAVCPVADNLEVYILSPKKLIHNIIHGIGIPSDEIGADRAFTLPGLRVSVGQIISALEKIAGTKVASRIVRKRDDAVERIVASWPGDIAAIRARALGFESDENIAAIIHAYIEEELQGHLPA